MNTEGKNQPLLPRKALVLRTVAGLGLFILRTALEDKTLQEELPGYKEYAQKVRFRLIPGVW